MASGYYTDKLPRRKPIAVAGYLVTAPASRWGFTWRTMFSRGVCAGGGLAGGPVSKAARAGDGERRGRFRIEHGGGRAGDGVWDERSIRLQRGVVRGGGGAGVETWHGAVSLKQRQQHPKQPRSRRGKENPDQGTRQRHPATRNPRNATVGGSPYRRSLHIFPLLKPSSLPRPRRLRKPPAALPRARLLPSGPGREGGLRSPRLRSGRTRRVPG